MCACHLVDGRRRVIGLACRSEWCPNECRLGAVSINMMTSREAIHTVQIVYFAIDGKDYSNDIVHGSEDEVEQHIRSTVVVQS